MLFTPLSIKTSSILLRVLVPNFSPKKKARVESISNVLQVSGAGAKGRPKNQSNGLVKLNSDFREGRISNALSVVENSKQMKNETTKFTYRGKEIEAFTFHFDS